MMLKNITYLEGIMLLTKSKQKNILGGKVHSGGGDTCKATCNDGSLITVYGCSAKDEACKTHGGAKSCKCDYPGPFDPPPA
ncbi:hypothetical protein [Kordia sp.]|uniref:hypothetical protein n=1 Tax=Kordia sp. TaxID=1965332 RepID=UPI003B5A4B11